jgi:ABC-type transporter MlaC component
METASFNGLLRTLMYIILFYYAFKFLARLFLPVIVKKVVEKASENMRNQQTQASSSPKPEEPTKTKPSQKVGEYIDFEEVD